ncbi:MAG: ABC transporter substrate-binding protein [Acidimicrobiales bacterium]
MRRVAVSLVAVLALTACGTGAGEQGDATPSTGRAEALDPPAGPDVRVVAHAKGETEAPADPQRVVALDGGTTLPTLLDLGVPVVGAAIPDDGVDTALFAPGELDGIEPIGFPEPNLEAVAAARPDLIVGLDTASVTDLYDELSQIAPTVVVSSAVEDWKAQATGLADAVGDGTAVVEDLAAYEADVRALAADLGDPATIEVSVIRALGDRVRIHTRFHFAGQVIDEVGLSRPVDQRTDDPATRQIELSPEQLSLADADAIYLYAAGSQGSAGPPPHPARPVTVTAAELSPGS